MEGSRKRCVPQSLKSIATATVATERLNLIDCVVAGDQIAQDGKRRITTGEIRDCRQIAAKHAGFAREVWRRQDAGPAELEALFGPVQAIPSDLAGYAGEDVTVIFLESYGTTLFDRDSHWPAGEPAFRAFEKRSGKMMVPYLVDPNTDTQMFESADIVAYLEQTYAK